MAITKTTKTAVTPEAAAISANEDAKAAFIEADEKVNRLSIAADEFDLGIDAIEASWDEGDETASAADFSIAQIEFKRAKALHEAAIRSAQAIQKSIINTSTTLAAIVAPYVASSHPDYGEVGVSFLRPQGMSDQNRPYATVVQSKPVRSGREGAMAGEVDVVFIRKAMHRELDGRKIEQAAMCDGISLSITSRTQTEPDYVVDTLHVIAHSAHAAVPVIDIDPSPTMAGRFDQNLAATFCGATRSTTDPAIRMQGRVYESAVVVVEATSGSIVDNDLNPNGKRFTTIDAGLKWSMARGGRSPQHSIDTYLRRIVDNQVGVFAPGLGVITESKIESLGFPDPLGETKATVRVTFASDSGKRA